MCLRGKIVVETSRAAIVSTRTRKYAFRYVYVYVYVYVCLCNTRVKVYEFDQTLTRAARTRDGAVHRDRSERVSYD